MAVRQVWCELLEFCGRRRGSDRGCGDESDRENMSVKLMPVLAGNISNLVPLNRAGHHVNAPKSF